MELASPKYTANLLGPVLGLNILHDEFCDFFEAKMSNLKNTEKRKNIPQCRSPKGGSVEKISPVTLPQAWQKYPWNSAKGSL